MAYEGVERRGDDVGDGERRREKSAEGLLARVIKEAVLRETDNPNAVQAAVREQLQVGGARVVDELFTEPEVMSGSAFDGDSQGQVLDGDSQGAITDEEWEAGDQQGLAPTHIRLLALRQKYPRASVEQLRAMIDKSR